MTDLATFFLPPPSLAAAASSSPTSSPLPSPSLSLARLAFVSQHDLGAALVRERDAAAEMAGGKGAKQGESREGEREGQREEWKGAVGPRSGRKIGKILRKSVDLRLDFECLDTILPQNVSQSTVPSTPSGPLPSPRALGSPGFKLFSGLLGGRKA